MTFGEMDKIEKVRTGESAKEDGRKKEKHYAEESRHSKS